MLFVSVYCHVFAFKRVYVCVCVYFCFDPLVCVSPPSGRVCIILPKDTMCLQRGLPHVDNVLGQKNVVFRVSRQTLDFFLHFEKKNKNKTNQCKIGNIPLFLIPFTAFLTNRLSVSYSNDFCAQTMNLMNT